MKKAETQKSDRDIIRDSLAAAQEKYDLSHKMIGRTSAFMLKEEAAGYLYDALAALRRSAEKEGCGRAWRPVGMDTAAE